jgi:hypothetical protein
LCRNCGGQDFLVERRGKSRENSRHGFTLMNTDKSFLFILNHNFFVVLQKTKGTTEAVPSTA